MDDNHGVVMREAKLPLRGVGRDVIIHFPEDMTDQQWDFVHKILTLFKEQIFQEDDEQKLKEQVNELNLEAVTAEAEQEEESQEIE